MGFSTVATLDYDAAKLFGNVREMAATNSIIIPDWVYATTCEWDTSALFALPLYYLTADLLLSFKLANIIMVILWVALIYGLTKRLHFTSEASALSCILVLLPYGFGMLEYWNMLFYQGCQYALKVMIPLLLVYLFLSINERKPLWFDYALGIIAIFLVFLTALSSGVYVFVCGIFPVLLYAVIHQLRSSSFPKPAMWTFIALIIVATVFGLLAAHAFGLSTRGSRMTLNSAETFADNAARLITGLFMLFSSISKETVPVLSFAGIHGFVLFIFVIAIIAFMIYGVIRLIKAPDTRSFLIVIALWNLIVLLACQTTYGAFYEYRYLLIGIVPLLIFSAAAFLDALRVIAGQNHLIAMVLALCLMVPLMGIVDVAFLRSTEANPQNSLAIQRFIEEHDLDIDGVYTPDTGTAEKARLFDTERPYVYLDLGTGELKSYDYYESDMDPSQHAGTYLYVFKAKEDPHTSQLTYQGEADGLTFYTGDAHLFTNGS